MEKIELRDATWFVGNRIGDASGFGMVFEATASGGRSGVVKLVPKEPGAERELLFEDLKGVRNVVPIIDSGEWNQSWALAMPRADRSLRAEIDAAAESRIASSGVVEILCDIVEALAGLEGRVVHRDLKPENVLLLEGRWCLADFGIARYAEASTEAHTRKAAMSPPYSAPERWRFERATIAADIYSLGIMAWEMLSGRRPFTGPSWEDFREQHLHETPSKLEGVPPKLASIVGECLYKSAAARPRPKVVLERLRKALSEGRPGASSLEALNELAVEKQGSLHAELERSASETGRRAELQNIAEQSLKETSRSIQQAILESAPRASADPRSSADDWSLRLENASIGMDLPVIVPPNAFGVFTPPFDVIAHSAIAVEIPVDRFGYRGRSHSLWFGDLQERGVYRWFEVGFMLSPLLARTLSHVPAALLPGETSGQAFANAITEWCLARPVLPIDQGAEDDFIDRWLAWFAEAAAWAAPVAPRST